MVSPVGPLRTYVYKYSIEENPEDMLMIRSNLLDKLNNFCTLLRKIHARNWMQWLAPTSGYPVTEPIASNRDKGMRTIRKTHQFKFTLAPSKSCWQPVQEGFTQSGLCSIEYMVYMYLCIGQIFPTNVTVWMWPCEDSILTFEVTQIPR